MKHNIIAQFSTSVWKSTESSRMPEDKSAGDFKDYPVINGSIFNEEYSETLDSATIVLSQIHKEDRLFGIKAYDFVRVFDAETTYDSNTDTYDFDKIYLIDNFHERENNIKEHFFGYTINLMSETKILEKFQCPNLVVTHKIFEDGTIFKKTIFKHIKDYMSLYVPKMKFDNGDGTWSYKPVVQLDGYTTDTYSASRTWDQSNFVEYNPRNVTLHGSGNAPAAGQYTVNVPIGSDINVNFISNIQVVLGVGSGTIISTTLDSNKRMFIVVCSVASGSFRVDVSFKTFDYYELTYGGVWISPLPFDLAHLDGIGYEIVNGNAKIVTCDVVQDPTPGLENQYVIYVVVRKYEPFETNEQIVFQVNANYYEITSDKWKKFDVPCADLSFGAPTLRQLLTLLMQQVGCIPVVKNRKLGYLDFKLEAEPFGGTKGFYVNDTVNFIGRGLSSDSFVNTIINMSNNVLDSENAVYCESLGFRDRNSLIIKQEQNLYLETKFPIYKVENFVINSYVQASTTIRGIRRVKTVGIPGEAIVNKLDWNISFSRQSSIIERINFGVLLDVQNDPNWRAEVIIDGDFVAFSYDTAQSKQTTHIHSEFNSNTYTSNDYMFDITLNNPEFDMFYFHGTISVQSSRYPEQQETYEVLDCTFDTTYGGMNLLTLYSQDITPLLLENSIRQYLSTDFQQMINDTNNNPSATIFDLAKYIYGTIGYSIGSNQISGFSNIYNVGIATGLGWLQEGFTYIENLWNFIVEHYSGGVTATIQKMYAGFPLVIDNDNPNDVRQSIVVSNVNPYNPVKDSTANQNLFSTDVNFAYMWFDIVYQPLNSFNLTYTKTEEDVDFPIEQYNGNSSGLTDFDRLAVHEQEIVDRVGNDTLSIAQRTNDFSDIQDFKNGPLYFLDNAERGGKNNIKYIVFKRSFTINNNCFNASYMASKDAVLKNYFTSIRTKYRAYQYVDYTQSVLRKERDIIYVRIGEDTWYDGDDKVYFGNFNSANDLIQQQLSVALLPLANSITKLSKNAILGDGFEKTKNDLSVVCYKNYFALVYEEADNVGSGTYFESVSMQQARLYEDALLGGVPQTWQIWNEGYNDYHYVSFSGLLNISDVFSDYIDLSTIDVDEIANNFDYILSLPLVSDSFLENNITISIVNDKNTQNLVAKHKRMFFKDYSERINHTVQFIYYTTSKNILWTERFIRGELESLDNIMIYDLTGLVFEINDNDYNANTDIDFDSERISTLSTQFLSLSDGNGEVNPYIEINWQNVPNYIYAFKIIQKVGDYYRDIVAFKRNPGALGYQRRFYITLNDTKSDYVMGEKNGILYRKYKVSTGHTNRTVEDID